MFEVMNPENSGARGDHAPFLSPRHIFMEGDGDTDKGLKAREREWRGRVAPQSRFHSCCVHALWRQVEWATVRDDKLYIGSFGKEFTGNKGEVLHANNLWVVVLEKVRGAERGLGE